MTISLADQALEVELHFLGLRDLHARAAAGKIKRGEHEVERLASRRDAAEAAACTLRQISERQKSRGARA